MNWEFFIVFLIVSPLFISLYIKYKIEKKKGYVLNLNPFKGMSIRDIMNADWKKKRMEAKRKLRKMWIVTMYLTFLTAGNMFVYHAGFLGFCLVFLMVGITLSGANTKNSDDEAFTFTLLLAIGYFYSGALYILWWLWYNIFLGSLYMSGEGTTSDLVSGVIGTIMFSVLAGGLVAIMFGWDPDAGKRRR